MADSDDTKLLRYLAGGVWTLAAFGASQQMFGKGYFALGIGEKMQVDQALNGLIWNTFANTQNPEFFGAHQKPAPGFAPPASSPDPQKDVGSKS